MSASKIAFRLWIGTLMIIAGIFIVFGVFSLNGFVVFAGILILIAGLVVSFPLLLTAVGLVRASGLLPYSATAKMWWLGAMLLLQNLAYLYLLGVVEFFLFDLHISQAVFYATGFALIIMLLNSRSAIKKYYSQQTTSNQQL
jgi:hypothetical protein